MPRYQITKIYFVQADNMDHAKKLVDEVKDCKALEIIEVPDGD